MAKDNQKIEGVIYSLPQDIAMNIFKEGKNVFVKYLPHEPTKKTEIKLSQGKKLYIYVSGLNKSVIGEAEIRSVNYMDMTEIIKRFKKRLMISESELRLYAEGRELKKAQVLELEHPVLYPKEIKVTIPITMGGAYVNISNKKQIFGK